MLEYFNITKYKPASILLQLETMLTMDNCLSLLKEVNEMKDILYYIAFILLM